jgi:hypothetical protein
MIALVVHLGQLGAPWVLLGGRRAHEQNQQRSVYRTWRSVDRFLRVVGRHAERVR